MGTATFRTEARRFERGERPRISTVEGLSRRYHVPLRRFFEKRLNGTAAFDIDDLVQDVFLRLSSCHALEPGQRLDGYIFQIAMNLLRDRQRRMASRATQSHESFEDGLHGVSASSLDPYRILHGSQLIEQLARALYELPERSRAIFALYHFENLSHAQIAQRLGIAISTIEKHMRRVTNYLLKRVDGLT